MVILWAAHAYPNVTEVTAPIIVIAEVQRIQAERSSLDNLFLANSARCGGTDPSLTEPLTVAAVRLHSQNKNTTVAMPNENHTSRNILAQCMMLIPFAMRKHLR
jgi:hypothetical protein